MKANTLHHGLKGIGCASVIALAISGGTVFAQANPSAAATAPNEADQAALASEQSAPQDQAQASAQGQNQAQAGQQGEQQSAEQGGWQWEQKNPVAKAIDEPAKAAQDKQVQQYGKSEPYGNQAEGENQLEPRAEAGRPLSDINEAMVDPSIANATPASLEGQTLYTQEGKKAGKIKDVVANQQGDVRLIVSSGGFLGIGEKTAALPVSLFKIDEQNQITLTEQPSQAEIDDMQAAYNEKDYSPVEASQAIGFLPGQAVRG